jgi:hypothetical protein
MGSGGPFHRGAACYVEVNAGSIGSNHVSISASRSNAQSACVCNSSMQGQMMQLAMREISAVSSSRLRSQVSGRRHPSGSAASR